MNFSPTSRPAERRRPATGFTLAELLVAMAVMAIILAMLAQILQMVNLAWINGRSNVNNFTKARSMLDLFTTDVQSGLFRSDLAAFPIVGGVQQLEFYTRRAGYLESGDAVRNVSLVNYAYTADPTSSTTMTTLQRGDMAIAWNGAPSSILFGHPGDFGTNTPTPRDTVAGVIDYKMAFVYGDGTVSGIYPSATGSPLGAVGFTLAVVDNQTLSQLTTSQVISLRAALDAAASSGTTQSIKAVWETYLANPLNLDWNSYPESLKVGLKIFERYGALKGF